MSCPCHVHANAHAHANANANTNTLNHLECYFGNTRPYQKGEPPPNLQILLSTLRNSQLEVLRRPSFANEFFSIAASIIRFPLIIEVVQMTRFLRPLIYMLAVPQPPQTVKYSLSSCFAMNRNAAISVKVMPPTNTMNTVCLLPAPDNNALALTALSSPF